MDNLQMINLIIGFFAPIVISIITQESFNTKARVAVTVAFSVVAGFSTAYFGNQFEGLDIITAILVTLVTSIAVYNGIFKPTGLASKIEKATSINAGKVQTVDKSKAPGKHAAAYFESLNR